MRRFEGETGSVEPEPTSGHPSAGSRTLPMPLASSRTSMKGRRQDRRADQVNHDEADCNAPPRSPHEHYRKQVYTLIAQLEKGKSTAA